MTVRHLRESLFLPTTSCSSPALTHSRCVLCVCARGRQTEDRECVCVWCSCTAVLTCQQTDTLWPEPNKVSSPVCGLWGRLCVSPPRGQCHASLEPLQQSADSTRPGRIKHPQWGAVVSLCICRVYVWCMTWKSLLAWDTGIIIARVLGDTVRD